MSKDTKNLILSILILIPIFAIISIPPHTDLMSYFKNGVINVGFCGFISLIISFFTKKYSWEKIFYSTNILISIIILLIVSLKYMS